MIHEKTTDPQIGGLIAEVDAGPEALGEWSAANFRLMKKQYVEGSRVPEALEKRKAQLGNEAYMKWAKAREASDFSIFEDTLSECFETAKVRREGARAGGDWWLRGTRVPRRAIRGIVMEQGEWMGPFVGRTLEWGGAAAPLLSVLSVVPRHLCPFDPLAPPKSEGN